MNIARPAPERDPTRPDPWDDPANLRRMGLASGPAPAPPRLADSPAMAPSVAAVTARAFSGTPVYLGGIIGQKEGESCLIF